MGNKKCLKSNVLGPGQTIKHCWSNIWNLLAKKMFDRLATPTKTLLVQRFLLASSKNVFDIFQKHHARKFAYFCWSSNVWSFGRLSALLVTHFFCYCQTSRACKLAGTLPTSISNDFIVQCRTAMFLDVAQRPNICFNANLKCLTNNVWLFGKGITTWPND